MGYPNDLWESQISGSDTGHKNCNNETSCKIMFYLRSLTISYIYSRSAWMWKTRALVRINLVSVITQFATIRRSVIAASKVGDVIFASTFFFASTTLYYLHKEILRHFRHEPSFFTCHLYTLCATPFHIDISFLVRLSPRAFFAPLL